ncbi:MAG: hydrogenase maturation nickel metallochaperone HypA, partial [Acidobacteriota bacterium]
EKFTKVNTITLKLGEMAGIDREALSFCFEVASKNTCAEGAALNFEMIPLMGKCRACESFFKVKDFVFRCPFCQGIEIEVVSGREIRISHINVHDGDK